MSVDVNVFVWPATGGELPITRRDAQQMFDLPRVGSSYWHGRDPFVVWEVERTEPPTVHLRRDPARAAQIWASLPEGCWLEGSRSTTDGRWRFLLVKDHVELPGGPSEADTLDDAVDVAVADAHRRVHSHTAEDTRSPGVAGVPSSAAPVRSAA